MDVVTLRAPWLLRPIFTLLHRIGPAGRWQERQHWRSDELRNSAATLENLSATLDENNVGQIAMLPIYPNVRFEHLAAAAEKEPRIIPFTGIDFDNLDDVEAKLAGDVQRGARGLKLHPILQRMSLESEETFRAVAAWEPHGFPVLFHAGYCNYFGCTVDREVEEPENGYIASAVNLVNAFPGVRFVAAHGALEEVDDLIELLGDAPNLWVDVSFQEPEGIHKLVDTFGEDRVMYASDWPYGSMDVSLHRLKAAYPDDEEMLERLLWRNAAGLLQLD